MGALAPDGGPGAGGAPEGSGASGGGPRSPAGEQLDFYLREEPHLFAEAVREQMHRLEESARDDAARKLEAAEKAAEKGSAGDDMVLYERMGEVRALERSNNLQDIMYYSVVAKFLQLGVGLIEPLDGVVDLDGNGNLKELTEDVHSVEALEMVRNHLMQVLTGPSGGTAQSLNNMMKISKLQSAQVYAASIMFGYFLRRVDKRFQLDRAMGSLPDDPEDMARRLEEIFNSASADASWDEEEPPPTSSRTGSRSPQAPTRRPPPWRRSASPRCRSTWRASTRRRSWRRRASSRRRPRCWSSARRAPSSGTCSSCSRRCRPRWGRTPAAWRSSWTGCSRWWSRRR